MHVKGSSALLMQVLASVYPRVSKSLESGRNKVIEASRWESRLLAGPDALDLAQAWMRSQGCDSSRTNHPSHGRS